MEEGGGGLPWPAIVGLVVGAVLAGRPQLVLFVSLKTRPVSLKTMTCIGCDPHTPQTTVVLATILAVVLVRSRRSKKKLQVDVRRTASLEPSVPPTPATPITPCPFGDASAFSRDPLPQSRFAVVAEQMTEMSSEDACGSVTGTEHDSLCSEPRP